MDIRNVNFALLLLQILKFIIAEILEKPAPSMCRATLPRSSSGSIDQDIDLRTEQMHYEERIPSMNQTHSSWQHIISPNIHRKTGCEETAAAEVSSQYGVENQNPYNPEISDFLFPGMAHGKENQIESAYSLQPSDNNSAVMNQNHQFCEAWNLNHPVNAPVPVAEPCALPGFQRDIWPQKCFEEPITSTSECIITNGKFWNISHG
ncbi:hypothetical protein CDAR_383651 [Caerostris darwini]|uniref:Uncharacterized protein n=1 Tax=Caerostris darwini TaxID=1538125 RepID=A0AAV4T236_9ARAC|nr:hypothetical protein CDAR_383651 [Caerostris darwini]